LIPLLFIKHKDFNARTVDYDLEILRSSYGVNMYEVNTTKGPQFFTALVKQFFFLLFNLHKYKIVFIWFADYHSLLPVFLAKIYRRKAVINIGGYDADEILTGSPKSLKERFRKFCVSYSVKNASMLLPVSRVIEDYLLKEVPPAKCQTIYCCVDAQNFSASPGTKENLVITVGGGGEFIKEAKRKRLDFFIELGNEFNRRYPQYNAKFYLIGHNGNTKTFSFLKPMIQYPNVELKPVTQTIEELVNYYNRASVYMQLSYYESFGIAQAEAMSMGCIPVSNPGGAIPEVVGDAGFLIAGYDKEKYLNTIKEILDKKHEHLRGKAKQRVLDNFTLPIRREKLLKALGSLHS
jgi:glycosyltransferase involved in cell wall biosynthesis